MGQTLIVERDVEMMTRDGVTLRADVYRPQTSCQLPVLLQRTPYGKAFSQVGFALMAAERGYAPSLVMVKDQAERGTAYQYYVEQAAALPWIVGTHYFQFADQPVTGRFDGENYNLGFVSQQDLPYAELVESARSAHRRMYPIHAGKLEPTRRQARVR